MAMVTLFILSDMAKRDEHVAFRISGEDKAKLMAIAQEEGRPLSNLIARIVTKYLKEVEAEKLAAEQVKKG
jgi:predicted DNA-binding protein